MVDNKCDVLRAVSITSVVVMVVSYCYLPYARQLINLGAYLFGSSKGRGSRLYRTKAQRGKVVCPRPH